MRRILLASMLACACACANTAFAQDASPVSASTAESASVTDLDSVVVRGVVPGPGLWKVSKGDHVLWVLGTLSPLPKDITWDSHHVESVIAKSQEVLAAPQVGLKANTGFMGLGLLTMLPSLIGLRNNPDGAMLKDVVSPDLYARWSVLKQKYIGGSNKVEKWRPIFAALNLYEAAIDKAGLTDKSLAQNAVAAAAKHSGVKTTTPTIEVAFDNAKVAIKEFKASALDDRECFRKTLDRIDTDLDAMTARANAWSMGDIDALRKLPYTDQMGACMAAISETQMAQKRGAVGIEVRAQQAWLDAAAKALDTNNVTFAMLPISRLLRTNGYLARLKAMGYAVEEPASKTPVPVEAQSTDSAGR